MTRARQAARNLVGAALLLVTPGAIACFAFLPNATRDDLVAHGLSCPFRDVTSIPCPFCGMTHALARLASLDFAGAFRAHPLWPLVIAAHVICALVVLRGRPPSSPWSRDARVLLPTIAVAWMLNVIHQVT
jgi:hypothetical protein